MNDADTTVIMSCIYCSNKPQESVEELQTIHQSKIDEFTSGKKVLSATSNIEKDGDYILVQTTFICPKHIF